ncbi:MAG: hypothetical protein NZ873_02575, partial [Crenarchaeota archaeon]|nr:hypothetical protein [Thermoproteota archaeon]
MRGKAFSSFALFQVFKTVLKSMGFTVLGLLLLGSILSLIAQVATLPDIQDSQCLDSTISVIDHYGAPAVNAYVAVFELADGGPRKLSEGFTDFSGAFKTSLRIPRRLIHVTVWKRDEAGNLHVDPYAETRESYAPVNIWIIAHKTYEESGKKIVEIGTLTFSTDPSEMKHPVGKLNKTITLSRIEPPNQKTESSKTITTSSCQIPTYPYQEEKWEYTTVLKFATWDNIGAKFTYFPYSQIIVESKERYF